MGNLLYGDSQYRVQKATVDANRLTQAAHNERAAAETSLQQFSAALGNRRRMDAAGKNMANLEGHIARNIDAKTSGDLNAQIGLAEELGSYATMASAAGVGGSSIAAYNSTVRIRAAMSQEQGDRTFNSDLITAEGDKASMLTSAVDGFDNNVYRANLDYRRWVDPHKQSLLSKIAEVGVTAAATYFGGPQAGQAVMNMWDSAEQAQNGDFAGAAASFNNGLQNGVAGFKAARTTGFNGFFNDHSGAVPQVGGGNGIIVTGGRPQNYLSGYVGFTVN